MDDRRHQSIGFELSPFRPAGAKTPMKWNWEERGGCWERKKGERTNMGGTGWGKWQRGRERERGREGERERKKERKGGKTWMGGRGEMRKSCLRFVGKIADEEERKRMLYIAGKGNRL